MAQETAPNVINIERARRGFVATTKQEWNPAVMGNLYAFDRIEDLAVWLVEQFSGSTPAAAPAPTVIPDLIRHPASPDAPWHCPIGAIGCVQNCGNYGCGN